MLLEVSAERKSSYVQLLADSPYCQRSFSIQRRSYLGFLLGYFAQAALELPLLAPEELVS